MKTTARCFWMGIWVLTGWALATGQVRRVGGSGTALDASLQIGSGGINYAVPQNYAPSGTGMSGITRTRGLSAFMGHAPSLDNQLQVNISTDGVSRFERQSVSLGDVRSGNLYRPQGQVYNDPMKTTLSPQNIVHADYARKLPSPGGTVSKTTKLAEDLFVDATADYKPVMPNDAGKMMVGNALGVLPERKDTTRQDDWMNQLDSRYLANRGGQDLFGMPREKDRTALAREISEFDRESESEQALDLAIKPPEDLEPIQPIDSQQKQDTLAERLERPSSAQQKTLLPGQEPPADESSQPDQRLRAQNVDLRTGLPRENADPFFDLLVQFRQQKMEETRQQPGREPSTPPMDEDLLARIRRARQSPAQRRNVEFTPEGQIVIHRLAGEGDDAFNRYMRRAESALKAGEYYKAARLYGLASLARPTNPMAKLGGCLASFAADEWMTSAQDLRSAMELFPPLMETQPDLLQLLPIRDWPQRLEALEYWVEKVNNEPLLLFLATFMQYHYGHQDIAKKHAEALRQWEKKLPWVVSAYAEYVLTGTVPARVKTQLTPTN